MEKEKKDEKDEENITVSEKLSNLSENIERKAKEKIKNFKLHYYLYLILWMFLGYIFITPINNESPTSFNNHFHSSGELAITFYEFNQISRRIGANCVDGTISHSTGSGTCSWHGGVSSWKHETTFKKTYKQCLTTAQLVSWID